MKARLVERGTTAEQIREIPMNEEEFLIGRGADCNLRLRISSISRHHCLIRLGTNEATVVDLGSSNGTYLNGNRVRSQAALRNGDEIQVGSCKFQVELGDDADIDLESGAGADPSTPTVKLPPNSSGKKPLSAQDKPSPSQPPEKPGGGPG
jgi:pSer/pThr/pTyr-binding forkhead associated (FHA) protein